MTVTIFLRMVEKDHKTEWHIQNYLQNIGSL